MTFRLKKSLLATAVTAAVMMPAINANAGGTITFGEDKYVSVGFGMRGSFTSVEDAAPNGSSRSQDFNLDNTRIFLSGSLNKYIKGMLNVQNDDVSGYKTFDANVQFAVTPDITIWAGRFLSPSDRANLAGPYYTLGGGYWSTIASRYGANGGIVGRDDGVAVVGTLLDQKFQYSFGAFEGKNIVGVPLVANASQSDHLMYSGRLQYDFWDAEPGYYGTGNYLGAKDILAVGLAGRYKGDGVTSAAKVGDYTSYSLDFLLEKKDIGPGAVSVEAAYYDYDNDGVVKAEEGKAYSGGAGYIFNDKVGWGQFQPFARYQKFKPKTDIDVRKYDLGVAYIIDGYNAQISSFYSNTKTDGASSIDAITVAMQFQF